MSQGGESEKDSTDRVSRWLWFLAWFFLFILLPLGISGYLVRGFFDQERALQEEAIVEGSRKFLRKIAGWTEISFQLERKFQLLRDQYFQQTLKAEDLPKLARDLKKIGT